MEFRIYKDKRGEWRWRLVARNGRIMADSAEGYSRRSKCVKAIRRILEEIEQAKVGVTDGEQVTWFRF